MATSKQAAYEVLRHRCVELTQLGWKQTAIAQALGLTQGWVSRTMKKYTQHGASAIEWRKRPGSTARLSIQQVTMLVEELSKGPVYHGFNGDIWTRPRVNEIIKKLFGVSYDPSQVGRLLKKAGWTRQKPQRKARQQDAQAVEQWRTQRIRELKKSDR